MLLAGLLVNYIRRRKAASPPVRYPLWPVPRPDRHAGSSRRSQPARAGGAIVRAGVGIAWLAFSTHQRAALHRAAAAYASHVLDQRLGHPALCFRATVRVCIYPYPSISATIWSTSYSIAGFEISNHTSIPAPKSATHCVIEFIWTSGNLRRFLLQGLHCQVRKQVDFPAEICYTLRHCGYLIFLNGAQDNIASITGRSRHALARVCGSERSLVTHPPKGDSSARQRGSTTAIFFDRQQDGVSINIFKGPK
jgi:hypothetical protein